MDTVEKQMGFPKDKSQDTLLKSLDRLEQNYEVALLEWQQISKVVPEKDVPQPLGSSKHLPKRLPKLVTLSDSIGSIPVEQAIRKKLVKVLSQCRMQEMQIRALEQTLETHTKKLVFERNQQLHLQHQLHTVLHKKDEVQKLTQKIKADLEREAPIVEIAERAIAENAKRLAKLDEEAVKIRGEAIDLLQVYQVRNEVHGQVEALSSRITALEDKKTKALERMRCLQVEEARISQNMNAAVTKVCAEQGEHAVEMDGKYHVLWSNVELLLGCCDKLLQMTRPEVEALRLDAHQAVESNEIQTFVFHSQVEVIKDNSNVVPVGAQFDVNQTLPPVQDKTEHEHFSQMVESFTVIERVHDESHVSVDNDSQFGVENAEINLEPIVDEDQHERDIIADKQELEASEVQSVAKQTDIQCKHPLSDQTKSDLNTHSTEEVLNESPSAVLTQNENSYKITENSPSPEFPDNNRPTSLEIQLDQEISSENTSVNFAEVQHSPILNGIDQCSSPSKNSVVAQVAPDGVFQASLSSPAVSQNNQMLINEETPQVSNTGSTFTSIRHFSQSCISHVSTSSTFLTLFAGCQIGGRVENENTITTHSESQLDDNSVLTLTVIDEKERDASKNQIENSSLPIEQKKSAITVSASHVEYIPKNTIIESTEHSPQVSSCPVTQNNFTSDQETITTAGEVAADSISSPDKLNITCAPLSFIKVDEESMVMFSQEKQHEKPITMPDICEQTSLSVSSACLTLEQIDKPSADPAPQVKEYKTLLNDFSLQDES